MSNRCVAIRRATRTRSVDGLILSNIAFKTIAHRMTTNSADVKENFLFQTIATSWSKVIVYS